MANEQVDLVAELEKLEDVPDALAAAPARGCRRLLSKCLSIPVGKLPIPIPIKPRICVDVKICW